MQNFADRLRDAIVQKGVPIVVGLDPLFNKLPEDIKSGYRIVGDLNSPAYAVDAIFEFCIKVLRIVAPYVPCVKLNIAFFEQYYWEGIEAYYSLIEEAKDLGLIVIGDVKRADIPSTNLAYANAHLADPEYDDLEDMVLPDAVTVNPYFGLDALRPFFDVAEREGKGVFVVLRTTNPEAKEIQDFADSSGRRLFEHIAYRLDKISSEPAFVGSSGYSSIGAVVGATDPQSAKRLREILSRNFFLVPGYGVQGGNSETIRGCFNPDGFGAIIAASRSIIYAYEREKFADLSSWQLAIELAVKDMVEDIKRLFTL